MSPDKQKEIVTELCNRIRDEMLQHIEAYNVPEEWDGIELRQWFADRAALARGFRFGAYGNYHPTSKRVIQYREAILVNDLLKPLEIAEKEL